jgi:hypothetical protein
VCLKQPDKTSRPRLVQKVYKKSELEKGPSCKAHPCSAFNLQKAKFPSPSFGKNPSLIVPNTTEGL